MLIGIGGQGGEVFLPPRVAGIPGPAGRASRRSTRSETSRSSEYLLR